MLGKWTTHCIEHLIELSDQAFPSSENQMWQLLAPPTCSFLNNIIIPNKIGNINI